MIHIISFTDKGQRLAEKIADILEGQAVRCGAEHPLSEWTRNSFSKGNALIYVGAAGIAVRAGLQISVRTLMKTLGSAFSPPGLISSQSREMVRRP